MPCPYKFTMPDADSVIFVSSVALVDSVPATGRGTHRPLGTQSPSPEQRARALSGEGLG